MAASYVRPAEYAHGRHAIQTYALDRDPRATNAQAWLVGAARVPDLPGRGWAAAGQGRDSQRADTALGPALVARTIADGGQPRLTPATVVQLQRTIGNAGVTRLLVARCKDGEVPAEGCHECGKPPPVQRRAAQVPPVQRQSGGRPTIRLGSTGPAVSELQSRLVRAGASIEVDGAFGGRTFMAVKATQAAAGLSADGIVGPKTWGAIEAGVQLPGGGTPPRGYRALLDQVSTAIGALRGAVPGTAEAAPVSAIGAARTVPPRHAMEPAVQRQDEEDEDESLWDQATDAASGAWDEASEAAGEAWDYGTDAAGEAWDAASEQAGNAWDYGTEAAGEAWDAGTEAAGEIWDAGTEAAGEVWQQAEEAAGGAWESATDTVEQLWDGATQVVESFVDEVAAIPGAIRERFGSEIAVLEQVIKSLGQGFRLTDEQIAGMTEIVTGLMDGFDSTSGRPRVILHRRHAGRGVLPELVQRLVRGPHGSQHQGQRPAWRQRRPREPRGLSVVHGHLLGRHRAEPNRRSSKGHGQGVGDIPDTGRTGRDEVEDPVRRPAARDHRYQELLLDRQRPRGRARPDLQVTLSRARLTS